MYRTSRTVLITLAAGCLLAAGAVADPVPAGSTFPLTNCRTCPQHQPVVASAPGGDFLAAWTGSQPQLVQEGIFGRPFNASGTPAGAPFAVEQEPQPPQYDAAAAADADGNYLLAWGATANGQSGIFVQRFNFVGAAAGPVIEVASDPASSPDTPVNQKPAVAVAPDGGFYVAWIALPGPDAPGGTPPRVMAQRFDAGGAPLRTRIQVSTGLVLGDRPSVCVDQTGRLIAVWTFVDAFRPFEPSKVGVAARRLRPRGAPIGGEIEIAPAVANTAAAAVSCGRRNSWVVTWHADGVTGDPSDVQAQIWNRGGQPAGQPFLVNTAGAHSNDNPSIAHDPAGNFVIAWETRTANTFGISTRRFAPDASTASGEVHVVTSAPDNLLARPAVATLGTSGFVVVWEGPAGAFGQRYSINP